MKVKLNFFITIVIKMISDRKVTKKRLGVSFRQAFLKNHDVFYSTNIFFVVMPLALLIWMKYKPFLSR